MRVNCKVIACLGLMVFVASGADALAGAAPYQCLIEPYKTVDLRSTVMGVISQVSVKRGDYIKKGQVLVSLESSSELAALQSARFKAQATGPIDVAQTRLDYAKRTFERKSEMHASKLMSAQEKDEAEGEMKSAEAELKLAKENHSIALLDLKEQEANFARRTIRSPLDGVVADRNLNEGAIVDPSDQRKPVLRVAQLNPLRARLVLPRAAFGAIKIGMKATITPEAPATSPLSGTVRVKDSIIDAASGTFAVFLDVANPKLNTPSGLRCQVAFADVAVGKLLKTE
jgi:RND family efflux transporter MFP subunit